MARITIKVPDWLDRICAWPMMLYRRRKYGYDFRRIYLGEGEWTILDQQDYYRFSCFKWQISGKRNKFYAVCNVKIESGRTTIIRLHREIMQAPAGLLVDHRNSDTLDNRRANLRLATHSENTRNRCKRKKTTSRFIGVWFEKQKGKWVSRIRHQGKQKYLGRFDSEIDAAREYDAAAKKYHGQFAKLNFPEEMDNRAGNKS